MHPNVPMCIFPFICHDAVYFCHLLLKFAFMIIIYKLKSFQRIFYSKKQCFVYGVWSDEMRFSTRIYEIIKLSCYFCFYLKKINNNIKTQTSYGNIKDYYPLRNEILLFSFLFDYPLYCNQFLCTVFK